VVKLTWARRGYGWFKFESEDFSRLTNPGVYAIWLEGSPGRYVRVGSGNIGERLGAHQADTKILYYRRSGILRVTWATVLGSQRLGD
jgi:hypothetical protein